MPQDCYWGKPCTCSDCRPDLKKKGEIYLIMDGYKVGSKLLRDKKGGESSYSFKTYCIFCYDEEFGAREKAYYEVIKAAVRPRKQMKRKILQKHNIIL